MVVWALEDAEREVDAEDAPATADPDYTWLSALMLAKAMGRLRIGWRQRTTSAGPRKISSAKADDAPNWSFRETHEKGVEVDVQVEVD